jgi:hypothetical protein
MNAPIITETASVVISHECCSTDERKHGTDTDAAHDDDDRFLQDR